MANRIILNEVAYHGFGAINHITEEVKSRRLTKALICSDTELEKAGLVKKITDLLDAENMAYDLFLDIKPNPTIENCQERVRVYKETGADYLIAVGGGSVMHCAKAIGIIINNPEFGDVRSLEGLLILRTKWYQ